MEHNCIFPHDLVEDILSRLPVRDLLRLRCVCKEWCAVIDDASFIKKHYQVQYSICKVGSNMPYFITEDREYKIKRTEEAYLLSIHQGDIITLNLTDDLERDSNGVFPNVTDQFYMQCCGCVNGIICLSFINRIKTPFIDNCFLALWNPATREFKTVAYPNAPGLTYGHGFPILGFGFDLSSNDFKIFGVFTDDRENDDELVFYHKLYSLNTNSWKTIPNPPPKALGRLPWAMNDGYFDGVYYMTTDDRQYNCRPSYDEIVSFNFASEVFTVSDLPQEAISLVTRSKIHQVMITLYKEKLGLFVSHEVEEFGLCSIDIWVVTQLNDCGVPLSWQHLFTIEGTLDKLDMQVISTLMNGDLLLTYLIPTEDMPSFEDLIKTPTFYHSIYNQSRGDYKKFEIDLVAFFRYVESLFSISSMLV